MMTHPHARRAPTDADRELLAAAGNGSIADGVFEEILAKTLAAGASVDVQDEQGRAPLALAAAGGRSYRRIQALLRADANPYLADDHGRSPLRLAAEFGPGAAVAALLETRASARVEDRSGWLPIHGAAVNPNPEALALLAPETGHSPLGGVDLTPIELAMARGNGPAVGTLIRAGADLESAAPGSRQTVIQWIDAQRLGAQVAALAGPEGRAALEAAGVDLLSRSPGWVSGLAVAASAGALDGVQFMLEREFGLVAPVSPAGADTPATPSLPTPQTPENLVEELNSALRVAAVSASPRAVKILEALVEAGADVNDMGEFGRQDTPLIVAAKAGLSRNVDALVGLGAEVNRRPRDGAGISAAEAAAAAGHVEVVRALREHGADLGPRGADRDWTLTLAARKGGARMVEKLLEMGLPADQPGRDGESALWIAAEKGSAASLAEIARFAPKTLDTPDGRRRVPPIVAAAAGGHAEAAIELATLGAKVDAVGRDERSALQLFAAAGHTDAALALLELGANPRLRDHEGRSALIEAADRGDVRLVSALVAKGADPLLFDHGGRSALIHAAECREDGAADAMLGVMAPACRAIGRGGALGHALLVSALRRDDPTAADKRVKEPVSAWTLRALLGAGARVDSQDNAGELPIHHAARDGNHAAIEILAAAASPIDARAKSGYTPLMIAASVGAGRAVESLLRAGATPTMRLPSGADPYRMARMATESPDGRRVASARAAMRALIGALPDLNAVGWDATAPLIWASRDGDAEMIALMLDRGADPNQANREGDTPLGLACAQAVEAARDRPGRPLDLAAVKLLLAGGAKAGEASAFGRHALAHATEAPAPNAAAGRSFFGSRLELCALLIEAGADPTEPETAHALRLGKVDAATLSDLASHARLKAAILGEPEGRLAPSATAGAPPALAAAGAEQGQATLEASAPTPRRARGPAR